MRKLIATMMVAVLGTGLAFGQLAGDTELAVAQALQSEGQTAEAKIAYEAILAGEGYNPLIYTMASLNLGNALNALGEYTNAVTVLSGLIADPTVGPVHNTMAAFYLGNALRLDGDAQGANAAYMAGVLNNVQMLGMPGGIGEIGVLNCFNKINPLLVEDYEVFLRQVLLLTPATEVNAGFLGRVKSELEKLQ